MKYFTIKYNTSVWCNLVHILYRPKYSSYMYRTHGNAQWSLGVRLMTDSYTSSLGHNHS
jgi:hypothetical protein